MIHKTTKLLGSLLVLGAASLQASNMHVSVNTGGFLDALGEAKDGMQVAVVFDLNGDGFGGYDAFDFSLSGQYLTSGGVATDDLFVFGTEGFALTTFAPMFGHGSLAQVSNIDTTGLLEGTAFSLIWFAEGGAAVGQHYGLVSHENFIVPTDGGVTVAPMPFGSLVPGAADYTFAAVIPEPTTVALGLGLVAAGLVALRRRQA
ncbi:MAG: hypothetical protein Q7P63_07185 [Verrucomicrobiota bacterium JB022]|nr:hypothetical protein [Verrucomicrobiota bacterium JB022]